MLTTELITRQIQMPTCRYEILERDERGPPVRFARIGDAVYHKWTCDADTDGVFCMRVHSCTVSDGQGGRVVTVIGEDGCAIDRYIIQNLDYTSDLMAGQEAHVFKFADRAQLHFNCQIELSLKPPTGCRRAQPTCSALPIGIRGNRTRRIQKRKTEEFVADFDLPEKSLTVFDLPDDGTSPERERHSFEVVSTRVDSENSRSEDSVCFTIPGFATLISVLAVAVLGCVVCISAVLLYRNSILISSGKGANLENKDWKN